MKDNKDSKLIGWMIVCASLATLVSQGINSSNIKEIGLYFIGWLGLFMLFLIISGGFIDKK